MERDIFTAKSQRRLKLHAKIATEPQTNIHRSKRPVLLHLRGVMT
jgi:hypothetical protein